MPSLEMLDPELCWLAWELEIEMRSSSAAIQEIFMFLDEDSRFEITEVDALTTSSESTDIAAIIRPLPEGGIPSPPESSQNPVPQNEVTASREERRNGGERRAEPSSSSSSPSQETVCALTANDSTN